MLAVVVVAAAAMQVEQQESVIVHDAVGDSEEATDLVAEDEYFG